MSNPWIDLLKKLNEGSEPRYKKVVIVCAPNVDSLRQFEAHYLPNGLKSPNKTLNLLAYNATSSEVRTSSGRLEHILDIDVYSIPFPVMDRSVDYVKAFVKLEEPENCSIHYFFLLDWSMSDQRFWLRQLNSSVRLLRDSGCYLPEGSITVCCLNTEHIYTWQKNTAHWLPRHIEFVQQSLRAFCLLEKCSLLYSANGSNAESLEAERAVFIKIISRDFAEITPELVNPSNLLIPYGSDSLELIKTVSDSFDPTRVLQDEFIHDKFETFVPCVDNSSVREEDPSDDTKICVPFKVDIQHELSKIYHNAQAQSAIDEL